MHSNRHPLAVGIAITASGIVTSAWAQTTPAVSAADRTTIYKAAGAVQRVGMRREYEGKPCRRN